ncbi:aureocin A53 family class IId bacteriocin [Marinococcus sp. PL1-022]|nr:aureocin A53 family class IId bacteriocin [Marinococcus sp. PL1-022]MDX6154472.1 aureocin A53 family class IId bacteriocin [Marinococcus sp. PL1-022]
MNDFLRFIVRLGARTTQSVFQNKVNILSWLKTGTSPDWIIEKIKDI